MRFSAGAADPSDLQVDQDRDWVTQTMSGPHLVLTEKSCANHRQHHQC